MRPFCVNCMMAHGKIKITLNGGVTNVKPPKLLSCHAGGNEMLKVKPDFTCSGFKPVVPEEGPTK